jgi:hypothetical protein
MTIKLTKSETVFLGNEKDLGRMREGFSDNLYIKLPGILPKELLEEIQHNVEKAEYYTLDHGDAGLDLRMYNNSTHELLHVLVNDRKLLDLVGKITKNNKLKYFSGRVYKMIPGGGHYDSWHTDISWHRVLTLSINLSTEAYSGGVLRIRDRKTKQIIQEVSNTVPGDGILFPISTHLEHMVTNVEGAIPKIAFAGWFNSEIPYESFFRTKNNSLDNDFTSNISSKITYNSKVCARDGLLFENLNDCPFIFDPTTETAYGLDSLGVFIWDLISKPRTIKEIGDVVLRNYETERKQCERDILLFLKKLECFELIDIELAALEKELV